MCCQVNVTHGDYGHMVRVVGVDPGTGSFDFCGLDDGEVFLDSSIPSTRIQHQPSLVADILKTAEPLDLIVGPSGYGLPLKNIRDLTGNDEALMRLVRFDDEAMRERSPIALGKVILNLKQAKLPVYFIPGVKHLPTVPIHRKINRIDMGTADKVCTAALGIEDQAKRLGIPYREASFILVEMGWGFTAVLSVNKGKIIDGIGGTQGCMGFLASGGLDAEIAYLKGGFSKTLIFQGGVAAAAGMKTPDFNRFIHGIRRYAKYRYAWEAWLEGVKKDVASMLVSTPHPREILLAGRISKHPFVAKFLRKQFHSAPVVELHGFTAHTKEAAQGAAIIAEGLAGGKRKHLVETLQLKKAAGSVLDHIYLQDGKRLGDSLAGF